MDDSRSTDKCVIVAQPLKPHSTSIYSTVFIDSFGFSLTVPINPFVVEALGGGATELGF